MALNRRSPLFFALLGTLTLACSAGSKSGASEPESLGVPAPCQCPQVATTPQSCPPTADPVCPDAPDPVAEPSPIPQPSGQRARRSKPEVIAVLDPTDWPSTIKGWYCFDLRRKRGDKSFLSDCERTKELCEEERNEMAVKIKRSYKGAHMSACKPYPRASCFTYQAPIRKLSVMRCFRTSMECLSSWADLWEEYPNVMRSQCANDIE